VSIAWRETITELLDGVETHLCPSAPRRARTVLAAYRLKAAAAESKNVQKRLEREIETCLQGKSYYRAAGRRYFRSSFAEQVLPALRSLLKLVEEHNRRWRSERERGR
jgi:hypothetical protein